MSARFVVERRRAEHGDSGTGPPKGGTTNWAADRLKAELRTEEGPNQNESARVGLLVGAHLTFSNFPLEESGSPSKKAEPPNNHKGELGRKGRRVWFLGQKSLGIGWGVLFHRISVKLLPGKSLLFVCTAVLGIALTLIVGPFGCALLCADDCCSDDSSCPICLFTGVHGAPASAPVAIVVVTWSPIPIPSIAQSEIHSANDHQLLPSRGPPALLAL